MLQDLAKALSLNNAVFQATPRQIPEPKWKPSWEKTKDDGQPAADKPKHHLVLQLLCTFDKMPDAADKIKAAYR